MHRRTLLSLLPLPLVLAGCAAQADAPASGAASSATSGAASSGTGLTVTDTLGRQVTLKAAPQRVFLAESRLAYSLLFLQKESPVDRVVAWADDFQTAAPDLWRRLVSVAPAAEQIPVVGSLQRGDLTVENVLAHRPEVALMTRDVYDVAASTPFLGQLEAAGVAYVVLDFRKDPLTNTRISVQALGALFERTAEAERFLAFYDGVVNPIVEANGRRTAGRPTVFHWRSPGVSEPGRTYGDINFGRITAMTGGDNLGTRLLGGAEEGTLSTEQLIASQPDLVIASGGAWGRQKVNEKSHTSYVDLGYDATEESARASLAALAQEPGYGELEAFRGGRVFGVYHQFYNAPFNFVVYQAFARWQGLEGHADVDVQRAWEDFHEQFMPFRAEGVVAVGLGASA